MSKHLCYHVPGQEQAVVVTLSPSYIARHASEDEALTAYTPRLPADAVGVKVIDSADLPTSRRLRDAWKLRGTAVEEDDDLARSAVRDRVAKLKRTKLKDLRDRADLDGEDVTAERALVAAIDPDEHVRGLGSSQLREDDVFTPPGLRRSERP